MKVNSAELAGTINGFQMLNLSFKFNNELELFISIGSNSHIFDPRKQINFHDSEHY